jgi:DNA-binding LytR/AlgR family response regulator
MLNCIIIDDEPLAVRLLGDYVSQTEGLALVGQFTNPIEGLQSLEKAKVDLLFLDVQMPELNGIQFAKIIKGRYPVILTTAYEEYALQGYDLDIVDYLLKPISLERFQQAIAKAQQRIQPVHSNSTTIGPPATNHIFIKSGYQTQRIAYDDILYLEGLSDYVRIQTRQGAILTLENMKNLVNLLPEQLFMRVHRSYIIALNKINYIENNRIVIDEKHIPISASYQEKFWEFVGEER